MGRIESFLTSRRNSNLLRTLVPATRRANGIITIEGKEYFDFCSNDYLGIANHPALIRACQEALVEFGAGACASRLLSGDSQLTHQLETELAAFKAKESALVFNSGYQANTGIIGALCQKGDVIFSDKLNHASIIDGIVLSGAQCVRFFHNNMEHLESLLARERSHYKEALIVTESIFSMEGDAAPLAELVRLKEKYQCRLMIDEAHAT
ncbi:MAG: aminotransferase class I/II-fold pyridoxal phosphate-dependent enzyme, partial [Candidatus Omnitrophica bacterium]|nr:aminotransferase class I/II-fold pyridoxal phosphate-dependent enzyme [Candidatus Omnitrophota bacterium]